MQENKQTNVVYLSGRVARDATYSHEVRSEKFYTSVLEIKRQSGAADLLPLMVPERVIETEKLNKGAGICVLGQFRSYNVDEDGRSRLKLYVFAQEITERHEGEDEDANRIELIGSICKAPIYRTTPLGREVADLLLAVNRPCKRSDYIPCIVWGRNARFAEHLKVGDKLAIRGRVQSRHYQKALGTGQEERTAYEVSISAIEQVVFE